MHAHTHTFMTNLVFVVFRLEECLTRLVIPAVENLIFLILWTCFSHLKNEKIILPTQILLYKDIMKYEHSKSMILSLFNFCQSEGFRPVYEWCLIVVLI